MCFELERAFSYPILPHYRRNPHTRDMPQMVIDPRMSAKLANCCIQRVETSLPTAHQHLKFVHGSRVLACWCVYVLVGVPFSGRILKIQQTNTHLPSISNTKRT